MKTQKYMQKGFWLKPVNQYWKTDIYSKKEQEEMNLWAKNLYKEKVKADYINKL